MAGDMELIQRVTLSSPAASITFSGIPNTFTDLRIVFAGTADVEVNPWLRFNGDTGTNYSRTYLIGTGSSAISGRQTGYNHIIPPVNVNVSIPSFFTVDVFSYASSIYKTVLISGSSDQNGTGQVGNLVALWRSTSAITTISIAAEGTRNWNAGTTATLFGVK